MFQNKNNQTTDGGQTILTQADDLPVENLPVHTMKKDLEEIKHPELAQAEIEFQESESRPRTVNREKLSEAQKGSPFLDFSAPKTTAPTPKEPAPQPEITKPITPVTKPVISDSRIKFTEPAPKSQEAAPATTIARPAPMPERPAVNYAPKTQVFEKPAEKKDVPQNLPVSKYEKPIFDSEKSAPEPKQHPHHINFNKVFAGVITVLVIAIIAGGGYYFWITRQSTPEVVVTPPVTDPGPEPTPEPVVAKFSIDKPNYLNIDDTSTPARSNTKDLLAFYASQVSQSNITTPVEFMIVDSNNNPVIFQNFAKKLNLILSPALTANLDKGFSLFIYNDSSVTNLGLAIASKDPTKLKNLMTIEEKTLAKNISPIFLTSDYTLTAKAFASSDYNSTAIRYINIISPEDLSVDYAIYNNKLVIGTTKMTLRSIIDSLKPELE